MSTVHERNVIWPSTFLSASGAFKKFWKPLSNTAAVLSFDTVHPGTGEKPGYWLLISIFSE